MLGTVLHALNDLQAQGDMPAAAQFDPLLMAVAAASLAVSALGGVGASSLLTYSPAKLLLRSGADGERLAAELEQRDADYQVVARTYVVGGLAGAVVAVAGGVSENVSAGALVLLGLVALFVCSVLPAAIAQQRAEANLVRALPLLRAGRWLLRWPVVVPIRVLTSAALRVFQIREEPTTDPEEIAEDVVAAVSDTVSNDALEDEEKRWIGNIVNLKGQQVNEIMTPRTDIVAFAADMPLRDAVASALRHGFSRYPVYREKVDEIIGIFFVKDALPLALGPVPGSGSALDPTAPVERLAREPFFVPETMSVAQLLEQFRSRHMQMAVVLDEYGGTAGIASIEDALEEIVGDIADEYDAPKGAPQDARDAVEVAPDGRSAQVPARMRVDEFNRLMGTHLDEDGDYETVGGLVTSNLNRIPAAGEVHTIDGTEFHVVAADDRRVHRLRIVLLQQPQTDGPGSG